MDITLWLKIKSLISEGLSYQDAYELANLEGLQTNPLEAGFTMLSKFRNTCRKQYGGCGEIIEEGDEIILIQESPRIWLHESCGLEVLEHNAQNAPPKINSPTSPASPVPSLPYTIIQAQNDWRKAQQNLRNHQELYGKNSQYHLFEEIERRLQEKVERMKQLWQDYKSGLLPNTSETCLGYGIPNNFMESKQTFTFWLDPDFTIPYTYKKEGQILHLGVSDPIRAKELLARYRQQCNETLYIKGEIKREIESQPRKPQSIVNTSRLPTFPSKGAGDYTGVTIEDWKLIRDAYLQAGIEAKIYVPQNWKQYALLINNRIRISTTVDIRGSKESRGKGVNAIDIVLVDDPDGRPVGGKSKVLRVSGWMGRVTDKINDLLQ